nr:hypothetical protein [Nostoc sp. ZfuVER08]
MHKLAPSLLTLVGIFANDVYGLIVTIKAKIVLEYCIYRYITPILLVLFLFLANRV